MEFIEGNWYKTIAGSFVKYSHTCSDGLFRSSENIMYGNQPHEVVDGKFGPASRIENFTEAYLSEFSHLLPEGHPDKHFVLPDCWYIIVTKENLRDCFKWRFSETTFEEHPDWLIPDKHLVGITKCTYSTGTLLDKGHNDKKDIISDSYNFGIEITYDQFKRYVLNQQKQDYSYLIKLFEQWNIK